MGLLRGPAHRQRAPGHPPRVLAGVQGHLPALPDHARLLGAAQGRLGLPRAAGGDRGGAAAGHHHQGADRELRHRRVQRTLPGIGVRVPGGLEPADRADRLLARPGRRLSHARRLLRGVGVVGAAPDLGSRAAVRGPQGGALLPALRHRAVLARGRARLPRRGRPLGVRAPAGDRRARTAEPGRRAAGVDHHPVDAGLQRGCGDRPGADLRARPCGRQACSSWPRRCWSGSWARTPSCSTASPVPSWRACATSRRSTSSPPMPTATPGTPCVAGDFVTAQDGTGLVHTAIAFGEDDFRLGRSTAWPVVNPVRPDGTYDERVGEYAGRFVKEADGDLVADLERRGRLLRAESYEHAYPHCWRCGTPLLYYAKPSWYIRTEQVRDELLAANETVTWHPAHIKHGRFGHWLEGNVDWALSRERYWGTPLPLWRCAAGHTHCIGSLAELEELSGVALGRPPPPLRGRRDALPARSARADEAGARGDRRVVRLGRDALRPAPRAVREPGALRAALPRRLRVRGAGPDAGLVLLAAGHLHTAVRPLAVRERGLPGADPGRRGAQDVQVGGQRGGAVGGDRPLRRRCAALVLLHRQAAVGRLPLLARDDRRGRAPVHAPAVEHVPLLRAVRQRRAPATWRRRSRPASELDRWVLSRLAATTATVRERLDEFDATLAGRAIADFVDELSNWYVRRSRRRFWDADPGGPLRRCANAWWRPAELLAPFCPFLADEMYENLDAGEPSVHLCDFPAAGDRDRELEDWMATARETVRLGLAARGHAQIKVRQPLREAVVVASGREAEAIARFEALVREELNVRSLRYVSAAEELGRYEVKPNYRALGPRFGRQMPQVAAAVAALDPAKAAAAVREGRTVGVSIDGHDHELGRRRSAAGAGAAGGLPGGARGGARGGAGPVDRWRAAPRGPGARGGARGAERPQAGRAGGGGPDRADPGRRRRAGGRRPAPSRNTWAPRRWPCRSPTTTLVRASRRPSRGASCRVGVARAGG